MTRCSLCNYKPKDGHADFCQVRMGQDPGHVIADRICEEYRMNENGPADHFSRHVQQEQTIQDPELADRLKPGELTPYDEAHFLTALPVSAAARKELPLATGLLDYFPAALVAVAGLSRIGNEQHNPGQPMHWNRGKSGDEADALLRHLLERGTVDVDGVRHSVKVAWRALALLQKELEAEGLAPLPRGAR